jgi:deoxyribodipyrimidine photo-lyase
MTTEASAPMRITKCNSAPVRADGAFVLYWMIAFRRTEWNYSLDRAIEWALELKRPLVIFEPLRVAYRWASDRIHRFVIDGMADNAARIARRRDRGVVYYPYVEPAPDDDKGQLEALADRACVVVTDDFPCFFLPQMVAAASKRLSVRMERVDSNGLLPFQSPSRVFTTAFSFRAFLQKQLPAHLSLAPQPDPLARLTLPELESLPAEILRRWPSADARLLDGNANALAHLPIDHSVGVVNYRGGRTAASKTLHRFRDSSLDNYETLANQPDENARSGLSPYLHFGHISPHQLFHELMSRENWSIDRLSNNPAGKRAGWWNVSMGAESWLDEFITWRELGFNMCANCDNYAKYDSLPAWAQATLQKHIRDRRSYLYSLDDFAAANTHDDLWNAAQRQLLREGRIHNYLRMLWGKKVLEWTATPREALEIMIELNNRYAIDGRDPNSYSGIFWCLGRYDRPWGPERPIFGTVRYMSSQNTKKKVRVKDYLHTYGTSS